MLFWFYTIESTAEAIMELDALGVEAMEQRKHETARSVELPKVSLVPAKTQETGRIEPDPGSFRIRTNSGEEFIAQTQDLPQSATTGDERG